MVPEPTSVDAAYAPLELSTSTGGQGGVVVVAIGEVDFSTAPALLSELDAALVHPSCRTLIVDLRGVRFLGARGVGALLAARRGADAHDVRLVLVADHRPVLRPLEIVPTGERLALFPTVAAARATARPPARRHDRPQPGRTP